MSSIICDVYFFDLLPEFAIIVAFMTLCWDSPLDDETVYHCLEFLLRDHSIMYFHSLQTYYAVLVSICINVGREDTE